MNLIVSSIVRGVNEQNSIVNKSLCIQKGDHSNADERLKF